MIEESLKIEMEKELELSVEEMKEKAEKKLTSVKSELDTTEREAQEEKERAKNMIEVVTSEMKTLKKSLEEVERREKQVGRNLGVKSCLGKIGQFES